jgi:hypothetical protein
LRPTLPDGIRGPLAVRPIPIAISQTIYHLAINPRGEKCLSLLKLGLCTRSRTPGA